MADATILTLNFATGVAMFFSPCGFGMLPAYIAFYLPRGEGDRLPLTRAIARGIGGGLLAATGALIVLGAIAALAVALGTPFKERVILLELVGGIVVIGLGILTLLGRGPSFKIPLSPSRKQNALGLVSFGALYAAVAASCLGALLIGIVFAALAAPTILDTTLEIAAFGGGLASMLLLLTVLISAAQDKVVRGMKKILPHTERVSGVLLILVGIYLIVYWARVPTG